MNNSIFREEWEKSKGAENILNISVLIGYKQGFVMLGFLSFRAVTPKVLFGSQSRTIFHFIFTHSQRTFICRGQIAKITICS